MFVIPHMELFLLWITQIQRVHLNSTWRNLLEGFQEENALSFLYSDASTLMLLQGKLIKDEGLAMYLRSCCREQLMGADFQLI